MEVVEPHSVVNQDGSPCPDWGHLPFDVLGAIDNALNGRLSATSSVIEAARLVNRHWGRWGTEYASVLRISRESTAWERAPPGATSPTWEFMLDAIARKFVGVRSLTCVDISDEGMAHVGKLTQLTRLDLDRSYDVTNAGVEHVGKLSRLTHLDLSLCHGLTDEGLGHVARLTSLEWLALGCCLSITDRGVRLLGDLKHLRYLDVHGCCGVTQACLNELTEGRVAAEPDQS
ncbi:unnamed protein product [Ostreobium quekettii]|uniref:F-box/LRR-repeat protein 15-like leucin rich repeat domain-containing protein n=1 Tax=Ostreobium quekettii TaxID=121088 RepID=A0A8S1IYP2_9CHLO|nr:unnamed protein product [Ostreobium quekettii]|eukprot:evm.model.scf_793EXC.1 EVM.evm.TU.scf_793EXC.1   scf_793EXC:20420-23176(-)